MVEVEHLQRITSETELASSKGNQNKWYSDGKWYKEDGLGYEALAEVLVSRPFSRDFDEQLDACELLFPAVRFKAIFTVEDAVNVLSEFRGIYDEAILRRVEDTIRMQIRKYRYMFS